MATPSTTAAGRDLDAVCAGTPQSCTLWAAASSVYICVHLSECMLGRVLAARQQSECMGAPLFLFFWTGLRAEASGGVRVQVLVCSFGRMACMRRGCSSGGDDSSVLGILSPVVLHCCMLCGAQGVLVVQGQPAPLTRLFT